LVRTHHIHRVAATAPVAEASIVVYRDHGDRKIGPRKSGTGIEPNQPKARINVPTMAIGMLCAGMGLMLPSLLYLP